MQRSPFPSCLEGFTWHILSYFWCPTPLCHPITIISHFSFPGRCWTLWPIGISQCTSGSRRTCLRRCVRILARLSPFSPLTLPAHCSTVSISSSRPSYSVSVSLYIRMSGNQHSTNIQGSCPFPALKVLQEPFKKSKSFKDFFSWPTLGPENRIQFFHSFPHYLGQLAGTCQLLASGPCSGVEGVWWVRYNRVSITES